MNRQGRALLRLLVGGYVIYLSYQLISTGIAGGSPDMSAPVALTMGSVIGLGGIGCCVYAFIRYFKDKKEDEKAKEQADSVTEPADESTADKQ
ncbi:MAG: hypothetical protein J6X60_06320 [Ruminiclostridium sp.]|nr:hypothetical protein [Ruminiclostridium sp.]